MVLISFLIIYRKDIRKLITDYKLIITNIFLSCLFLLQGYRFTGKSFFLNLFKKLQLHITKWNNTADLSFFTNLDIYNLLANPLKHRHADSLISITLLDTISDYFGFF